MQSWHGWAFTFAMIKPEVAAGFTRGTGIIEDILNVRIPATGLRVLKSERAADGHGVVLDKARARRFYHCHFGKFFYPRLVNQISSGPVIPLILGLGPTDGGQAQPSNAAVQLWRAMLGPTHLLRAQAEAPTSIRATYSFSDTLNIVHGADSPENAFEEALVFWPLEPNEEQSIPRILAKHE